MQIEQKEPDRSTPAWVLFDLGKTFARSGQMPGHKLLLREFIWRGRAWRPTGETKLCRSLYQGIEDADWIGKLPNAGRNRHTMSPEMLAEVSNLWAENKSQRAIARKLKISPTSVRELVKFLEK